METLSWPKRPAQRALPLPTLASFLSTLPCTQHPKPYWPSVSSHPFLSPNTLHLLFLLPEGCMSDFFSSIRPQLHISIAKRLSFITQQKLGLLKRQRTHKKKLFCFFPSTCFPIYCILPSLKYKLDQYPCSYLNYLSYHFISITWYHIWRRRVHKEIFFGMVRSMFLHESN